MRVIKVDDKVWGEYYRLEILIGERERRVIGATPEMTISNFLSVLRFENDLSKEALELLRAQLLEFREEIIAGKVEIGTEEQREN